MTTSAYRSLITNGYCIVRDILPKNLISRLQHVTEALCSKMTDEHRHRFRAQGSMFHTNVDSAFAELIIWKPALKSLKGMGFTDPKFTDGYIISKPPHSPGLFWHYDWFAWDDPVSFEPRPPQVFFMYYLEDTRPDNGCLRVIPGSHCTHNPLHDVISKPHDAALSSAKDLLRPEFSIRPDEIDVPVSAGDLLIGDARLLHATHPNNTNHRRTVVTLWFQPDFSSLPDRVKAQMVQKTHQIPDEWPHDVRQEVAKLNPVYTGNSAPYERTYYKPDPV